MIQIKATKDQPCRASIASKIASRREVKNRMTNREMTSRKTSSKNEKKIETGTTTMADIINLLGMPKDFKMHKDVQEAHYVYKNARVTLNFKDKKLTGYHILTN